MLIVWYFNPASFCLFVHRFSLDIPNIETKALVFKLFYLEVYTFCKLKYNINISSKLFNLILFVSFGFLSNLFCSLSTCIPDCINSTFCLGGGPGPTDNTGNILNNGGGDNEGEEGIELREVEETPSQKTQDPVINPSSTLINQPAPTYPMVESSTQKIKNTSTNPSNSISNQPTSPNVNPGVELNTNTRS